MPHWQFEDVMSPAEFYGFSIEWVAQVRQRLPALAEHIEALAPLGAPAQAGPASTSNAKACSVNSHILFSRSSRPV